VSHVVGNTRTAARESGSPLDAVTGRPPEVGCRDVGGQISHAGRLVGELATDHVGVGRVAGSYMVWARALPQVSTVVLTNSPLSVTGHVLYGFLVPLYLPLAPGFASRFRLPRGYRMSWTKLGPYSAQHPVCIPGACPLSTQHPRELTQNA
jgi:hypothetical protein